MFALLDNVCLTVRFLPTVRTSAQLYDFCLPVWCLLYCTMSSYLYYVCSTVWCSRNCVMSAYLDYVCSTVWYLPTYMTSSDLYDVCSTVWYLSTCMMLSTCSMSFYLYIWCMLYCMMSAQLYDEWPTCMMFSYLYSVSCLYDICSTVWCLPTWMMSALLYDVYLPTVYDFLLPVWCILYCNMSVYPMMPSHLYHVYSIAPQKLSNWNKQNLVKQPSVSYFFVFCAIFFVCKIEALPSPSHVSCFAKLSETKFRCFLFWEMIRH
jgi:hypothetical protein